MGSGLDTDRSTRVPSALTTSAGQGLWLGSTQNTTRPTVGCWWPASVSRACCHPGGQLVDSGSVVKRVSPVPVAAVADGVAQAAAQLEYDADDDEHDAEGEQDVQAADEQ